MEQIRSYLEGLAERSDRADPAIIGSEDDSYLGEVVLNCRRGPETGCPAGDGGSPARGSDRTDMPLHSGCRCMRGT
jgi:hypothetical protein